MAEGVSLKKWLVVSLIVVAAVVGVIVWITRPSHSLSRAPMTAEEGEYLTQIKVTDAHMSAATNFLGHTEYYLDAKLTNTGTKTVRELELQLTFQDPFGDMVLRATEEPVTMNAPPLRPGETIPLHFVFDQLPDGWNQGPPVIVTTHVRF